MHRVVRLVSVVSILAALSVACDPLPPSEAVSREPSDYVGEYIFKPDIDPGSRPSLIVLRKDGSAIEVCRDKTTGAVTTATKPWQLLRNGRDQLGLADESMHIIKSGSRLRLYVSVDVDEFYENVR